MALACFVAFVDRQVFCKFFSLLGIIEYPLSLDDHISNVDIIWTQLFQRTRKVRGRMIHSTYLLSIYPVQVQNWHMSLWKYWGDLSFWQAIRAGNPHNTTTCEHFSACI